MHYLPPNGIPVGYVGVTPGITAEAEVIYVGLTGVNYLIYKLQDGPQNQL